MANQRVPASVRLAERIDRWAAPADAPANVFQHTESVCFVNLKFANSCHSLGCNYF